MERLNLILCRAERLGTKIVYMPAYVIPLGQWDWAEERLKSLNGLVPIVRFVSNSSEIECSVYLLSMKVTAPLLITQEQLRTRRTA